MIRRHSARFADFTQAATFYGLGRAQLFKLLKLGEQNSDPLPVDDPAAMPAWFQRLEAKGLRSRPCPDSVLARACEPNAAPPAPPTVKQKRSKAPAPGQNAPAPPPPSPPPGVRITLDQPASVESIIANQMRLHAGLSAAYEKMIAERTQQSAQGTAMFRQIEALEIRILAYQKATVDIRGDDDKMDLAQVQAAALEMARAFHILLRRELPVEFPDHDHERVMDALDRVADRLPMMLPEALKGAA